MPRLIRIELKKAGRKPDIPLGALIAGGIWLLFAITLISISIYRGRPVQLCWFKRLTGIPCPTCGTTRGGLLILRGAVFQGWLYNPLVFTFLPVLFLHLIFQIISGYRIKYALSPAGRKIAAILLCTAIGANWLYEIFVIH